MPKKRRERKDVYATWDEAAAAARALGIPHSHRYPKMYKADPRLPSNPDVIYKDVWKLNGTWRGFLHGSPAKYPTLEQASRAAQALTLDGRPVRVRKEYMQVYKDDPRLPANPNTFYGEEAWVEFGGWSGFLRGKNKYTRIEDAMAACERLGIFTIADYRKRHGEDQNLPYDPDRFYKRNWERVGKWKGFLAPKKYRTIEEAMIAARKLKRESGSPVENGEQYILYYKQDSMLPQNPRKYYGRVEWERIDGWEGFLRKPLRVKEVLSTGMQELLQCSLL